MPILMVIAHQNTHRYLNIAEDEFKEQQPLDFTMPKLKSTSPIDNNNSALYQQFFGRNNDNSLVANELNDEQGKHDFFKRNSHAHNKKLSTFFESMKKNERERERERDIALRRFKFASMHIHLQKSN